MCASAQGRERTSSYAAAEHRQQTFYFWRTGWDRLPSLQSRPTGAAGMPSGGWFYLRRQCRAWERSDELMFIWLLNTCYSHHQQNPKLYIFKVILLTLGDNMSEAAHIRAVLSSGRVTSTRPLLVLSCIAREDPETARNQASHRTPCVDMAKRLELPKTANPWMVVVLSLSCISVNPSMTFDLCVSASFSGAGRCGRITGWTSWWHFLAAKVFWG